MKLIYLLLVFTSVSAFSQEIQVKNVYKNLRRPVDNITQYLSEEYQYYKADSTEVMHGYYKKYHPNVNKEVNIQGQYDHNKKIGIWKVIGYGGKLNYTEEYSNGILTENKDGAISKTEFIYGDKGKIVFNGKHTRTDVNGLKTKEGQYLNNKETGTWRYYDHSVTGKTFLYKTKEFKEGKEHGPFVIYWDNGQKHFEGTMQEGKIIDKVKEFNESGVLIGNLLPDDTRLEKI